MPINIITAWGQQPCPCCITLPPCCHRQNSEGGDNLHLQQMVPPCLGWDPPPMPFSSQALLCKLFFLWYVSTGPRLLDDGIKRSWILREDGLHLTVQQILTVHIVYDTHQTQQLALCDCVHFLVLINDSHLSGMMHRDTQSRMLSQDLRYLM